MKRLHWGLILLLCSAFGFAEEVTIVGQVSQSIRPPVDRRLMSQAVSKRITLLKIKLSDKAHQKVERRAQAFLSKKTVSLKAQPSRKVQLGMGSVPVLDQGQYGTCVTFAVTAAIDAVLNRGDYLSQLCPLQLGRYLENVSYGSNGWNGTWGHVVLNQLELFGMVSKASQRENGCGGLTEYPLGGAEPVTEILPTDYHQLSEPMDDQIVTWSPILDIYQVFHDRTDMNGTLNTIKATLNAGDRLTFGVLLLDIDQGIAGAVGRHQVDYDTWVLTPEIADDIHAETEFAGHEMIITGYDDDAIAVDDQGRKHQGLFTLRNSWGPGIGDHGNFYMSYDYFKTLTIEAFRIRGM